MSFQYDHAKYLKQTGGLNLASSDMRCMLVMANSTADTDRAAATIGGISTLDEMDGANYPTSNHGVILTGESVTEDNTNHRAPFDAGDALFTSLGAGTRAVKGAIVYAFVSSIGASIPVYYIDSGGFPFTANGSNVTIQWHANGIEYLA